MSDSANENQQSNGTTTVDDNGIKVTKGPALERQPINPAEGSNGSEGQSPASSEPTPPQNTNKFGLNDVQAPSQPPVVREREVIYVPAKKNINFVSLIWNFIKFAFLLAVIGLVLLVLTIIFKPPFLWSPLKTFLNGQLSGTATADYVKIGSSETAVNIDSVLTQMISSDNQNELIVNLTEQEFASLVKSQLPIANNAYLDFNPEQLRLLIDLDGSGEPLWLAINFKLTAQQFGLVDAGFGILTVPDFLVKPLQGLLQSGLGLFNIEDGGKVIGELSGQSGARVKSITVEDEKLVITFYR